MAQDRPDIDDLLATTLTELEALSAEATDDSRFRLRVCIHLLSIVRRELALGESNDDAERQRLSALLEREGSLEELNTELSARLRAGDFDARWQDVFDHLRQSAVERLAIVNPNHLRPEERR
ncbi:MAG: DUF6285 domain-containing protein [Alphaproteobacteria bacterium]|jgi:hypothetical protein|nr:hypothetical protein [Rhodospirillaceae bacterium]MDP6404297.1 DUF6285 domain-containing protein [Alphaproteobacteria bacterium]MDP6622389.1 DUF6285 domain-containing protein [Alphaproteobacteria bacterium]|tara:strand:+ start:767 stop:1132 length:366 start_codon:yes stop_codon:yes gene_type:complete